MYKMRFVMDWTPIEVMVENAQEVMEDVYDPLKEWVTVKDETDNRIYCIKKEFFDYVTIDYIKE